MTDKPIHELTLADYRRGVANMERKRYGSEAVILQIDNHSGRTLSIAEKTIDGRKTIEVQIEDAVIKSISRNGGVRLPRIG